MIRSRMHVVWLVGAAFVLTFHPAYSFGNDLIATATGLIECEVLELTIDGVRVQPVAADGTSNRELLIPWYELREGTDTWKIPEDYQELASTALIAHARQKRGDISGAADLYRIHSVDWYSGDPDTIEKVFGALLADASSSGNWSDAMIATQVLNMHDRIDSNLVDERFGLSILSPMLPNFGQSESLSDLGSLLMDGEASGVYIRAIRMLNEDQANQAQVLQSLEDLNQLSRLRSQSRLGVELYTKMFVSQVHPEKEQRAAAREWLLNRVDSRSGTWIEAWCRLSIAASLIRESGISLHNPGDNPEGIDQESVSRSVVQCVYVMLGFEESFPNYAREARRLAERVLLSSGRVEEAVRIMDTGQLVVSEARD